MRLFHRRRLRRPRVVTPSSNVVPPPVSSARWRASAIATSEKSLPSAPPASRRDRIHSEVTLQCSAVLSPPSQHSRSISVEQQSALRNPATSSDMHRDAAVLARGRVHMNVAIGYWMFHTGSCNTWVQNWASLALGWHRLRASRLPWRGEAAAYGTKWRPGASRGPSPPEERAQAGRSNVCKQCSAIRRRRPNSFSLRIPRAPASPRLREAMRATTFERLLRTPAKTPPIRIRPEVILTPVPARLANSSQRPRAVAC